MKCDREGRGGQKMSKFAWRHLWTVLFPVFKMLCIWVNFSNVKNLIKIFFSRLSRTKFPWKPHRNKSIRNRKWWRHVTWLNSCDVIDNNIWCERRSNFVEANLVKFVKIWWKEPNESGRSKLFCLKNISVFSTHVNPIG